MLIRLSQWARPLLVWWWKGDRFTDPIDGRSYRKFLPYGYQVQRANALSPGTLSLERHRLLWLYLQDKTDFFTAEHKVLHLAPEQCFVKRFRKLKNLDYTTADLNSPLADVQADITALPFEGDVFDTIRERLRKSKGRIRRMKVDYLAYSLIDGIIDKYFSGLQ